MADRRYPHPMPREGIASSIAEIAADAQRLVRLELELAKQEIFELVKRNGIAIGLLAGAGLCGLFFLYTTIALLVVAVVALVGHQDLAYVPLSLLLVWLIWLVAAAILGLVGKSRLSFKAPEATIQSLKEDVEWVRTQIRPATK
jgi:hypothetical protein